MTRRRVWPHKLWISLFRARRKLRRIERGVRRLQEAHALQLRDLTERYEQALAIERSRLTRVQQDWANNYFRLLKVDPSPTLLPVDLAAESPDPKHRPPPINEDPAESLSFDAYQVYLDKKDAFWTEGEELGRSEAEISQEWERVREEAIEDARSSIIGA